MKTIRTILCTTVQAASVQVAAQLPAKVESFPVSSVRLTASPFKHAEVLTVKIAKGDKRITPHVYEVRLTE